MLPGVSAGMVASLNPCPVIGPEADNWKSGIVSLQRAAGKWLFQPTRHRRRGYPGSTGERSAVAQRTLENLLIFLDIYLIQLFLNSLYYHFLTQDWPVWSARFRAPRFALRAAPPETEQTAAP